MFLDFRVRGNDKNGLILTFKGSSIYDQDEIMSTRTKIEWTEQTWNPSTGCSKVSPGCKHCYAEIMARRLKAMGVKGYENGFSLALHPNRLNEPLARRKPTMYFVNSMSDLFHEDIPDDFIGQVFEVMKQTPHHTFQVLTKRAERMACFLKPREVPDNAWIGVTVENIKGQCDANNTFFFFKQWGAWGVDGKRRSKKANGRLFVGHTWDGMPPLNGLLPTTC